MVVAIFIFLLALTVPSLAQTTDISGIINTYAPITGNDSCGNAVIVSSTPGFAPGDRVLLIQIKGAIIDSSDSPQFGSIVDYGGAGNYEFATIEAINGNAISFRNRLLHVYDPNGRAQMVRVPQFKNVRIIDTLRALPWNGLTGGVLAFEASDTVTMLSDISVVGQGFRGGRLNKSSLVNCGLLSYFIADTSGRGGDKGEGITELAGIEFTAGRGPLANGAGGGNDHNTGGGGGGNGGAGGVGGNEWEGCGDMLPLGGLGGNQLDSIANGRIFLGGGGGAAQQNDDQGTPGTNGGGLVIIRAHVIDGNAQNINASATPPPFPSGNDGAGGGGAGGTVLLDVDSVLSPLNVAAHGADGANAIVTICHGPGGGGGGGMIWLKPSSVPPTITTSVVGGASGIATCSEGAYGAQPGQDGSVRTGLRVAEGLLDFDPTPAAVAIELPSTLFNADPGDIITIPVILRSLDSVSFAGAGHYTVKIRINGRLLAPIKGTPLGTVSGNDRIITLTGTCADTICTIDTMKFLVLLGPGDSTEIVMESFAWEVSVCDIAWSPDTSRVTINICRTGDGRLIDIGAGAKISAISPDPGSDVIDVAFRLSEHGHTRLSIVDALGREVVTLDDPHAAPGEHVQHIDVRGLSAGFYLCVLQTPTERFSRAVRIEK